MTSVAPRIVNGASAYVSIINHESDFSWQAQYLMKVEGDSCCSRIVNDVTFERGLNHESDFSWQVQHFVTWGEDFCCTVLCK